MRREEYTRPTWRSASELTARGGKRVLVLGCSPLPFENERMNYAPGSRTWQFAQPLARAGHAVCVVCARIPGAYGEESPDVEELERDGIVVYTMPWDLFDAPDVLTGLVRVLRPEVLVGATALPSRRAVQLAGERPVWVDLFGDPMAEAQAKAAVDGDDDFGAYTELLWSLVERGDAFAAVSDRQRWAVVGQLGFFGRLNRATIGRQLVYTIPCATEGFAEMSSAVAPADLDDDDFVVLWSGGFNTWCDMDTLFPALEKALAAEAAIKFVATGGPIEGHDDETYRDFVRRVKASELRDRLLLKGRLPAAEADGYLARADLGVVTEKPIYERSLGSSARLARWLAQGLPFVCADVSELARIVAENGLGLTYPAGDSDALASRILEAAADPGLRQRLGEAGRRYAEREWSYERTTRPLVDWVERAQRPDDRDRPEMRSRLASPSRRAELEVLERRYLRLEKDYHDLRHELGEIHESKMWTWWMGYLDARRFLRRPFDLFRK